MPTHCPHRTTLGIVNRDGAFADSLVLPTSNLHIVPDTISDKEAIFVEPLVANFEPLSFGPLSIVRHRDGSSSKTVSTRAAGR